MVKSSKLLEHFYQKCMSVGCVCKKKSTVNMIPEETIQPHHLDFLHYCRSGNFGVKKLSYDKFLCKEFFVQTIPYCISINSAC